MAASGTLDQGDSDPGLPLAWRDQLLMLVQLVLVALVVWKMQLEPKKFLWALVPIAVAGFAIHARLPFRWRLAFFSLLSIPCLFAILGFEQGAWVLAIGGALIATASLPAPYWLRLALILVLAGILIFFRTQTQSAFWPILGSMFMFRMILFMQAIRRERVPSNWLHRFSYFFLFPNAFFTFFPVVDYRTYCDSYYDSPRREIYQTGVHWIVIGALQLLAYRFIKYELLPSPFDIRTTSDVAVYLATNYALYVRISGQFHLIVGILHLFGFNLPRTHDRYFLASSLSEIWRRINIYWKNFLMKVFFFPLFFRLRGLGNVAAVVLGVFWTFFWTWLAHSWYVFWLQGKFPLHGRDALLWMGVGCLVAVNAVLEFRATAKNPAGTAPPFTWTAAAIHMLKIVGVFSCVSLFWAKWTNTNLFKYLAFTVYESPPTLSDGLFIGGVLLGVVLLGMAVMAVRERLQRRAEQGENLTSLASAILGVGRLPFDRSVAAHLIPLICLTLLIQDPVVKAFGPNYQRVVKNLQQDRKLGEDVLAAIDGYYEQLNDGGSQVSPLFGDPSPPRMRDRVHYSDMTRPVNGLLRNELIAGWKGSFHGGAISVNRWSMRDRDRELVRPANTVRIALIGSSVIMGYGVSDDETISRRLEDRLNRQAGPNSVRYEVLNFGMGQHFPLQRRAMLEERALAFRPDLVIYFAHQDELYMANEGLIEAVQGRIPLNDPCLDQLVRELNLTPETRVGMMTVRLSRKNVQALSCTYQKLVSLCAAARVPLLFAYLPVPSQEAIPYDPRLAVRLAEQAGMEVLDLDGWWRRRELDAVSVGSGDDQHLNATGSEIVADDLEQLLRKNPVFQQLKR